MSNSKAKAIKQAGELFSLYPRLAERVSNLRTIIQNVEDFYPTEEDCKLWTEDVKSVMDDYMQLTDDTAKVLIELYIPSEKP